MRLNIIGTIFGMTGYDIHTRSLFNAIYKLNPDTRLDSPRPQDWERLVNDAELNALTKPFESDMTSIMIATPPNWRLAIADNPKHFIGFCVWEGDKIPEYWIEYLLDERVDQIWVPSQHTKDAIINTMENIIIDYNNFYLKSGNLMSEYSNRNIISKFPESISTGKKVKDEHYDKCIRYKDDKVFIGEKEYLKYFLEFILENKVKIVPHGVDTNIFKPNSQESSNSNAEVGVKPSIHSPDNFKFISNKGWRGGWDDRGGVAYVLKAFCEEFNNDENVELILKLNSAYINPEVVIQELDKLKLPQNRANIKIVTDNLTQKQLTELYNEADVYVCAQRADAFNIPGLEAMGCGLPTIQTGYGGQNDYLNLNNGMIIDYDLEDVKHDIQYEGIKWAIPNIKDLKILMRNMFSEKSFVKSKGKQALKDAQEWTWDISAKKAIEFINKIKGGD